MQFAGSTWSQDGNEFVFDSYSSNLVSGDSNAVSDVFLKNLVSGAVTAVDTAPDGTTANAGGEIGELSPDGSRIAFTSGSTNLVPESTNAPYNVYVRDLISGTTTLVSSASDGTPLSTRSYQSSWSPDGKELAFVTQSSVGASTDLIYVKDVGASAPPPPPTVAISLSPKTGSGLVGTSHTVTAQLLDSVTRNPVANAGIGFEITGGPNAGATGTCIPSSCVTGANGQVSWTYTSSGAIGSDTISAFYDLNSNGRADVGEPQATSAMQWLAAAKIVVGLGDSYSSGEGNDPFDVGTAVFEKKKRLDGCHRSQASWERQIGVTQPNHLACSGAVIANLTLTGQERIAPDNVPQVQRLRSIEKSLEATGKHVDDVVLTIGGNDIGFASIFGDCFVRECLAHFDKNERDVRNLRVPLDRALAAIMRAAPSAKVILVGYPRLFPGQQSGNVACGWLTPRERERANALAADLNVVEHQAANDTGATFVSVADALDGHELCSADSWVFPLNPLVYGADQRQAHPIYPGQAAIAAIVNPNL